MTTEQTSRPTPSDRKAPAAVLFGRTYSRGYDPGAPTQVKHINGASYAVQSFKDAEVWYVVNLAAGTCDCDDHARNRNTCKHIAHASRESRRMSDDATLRQKALTVCKGPDQAWDDRPFVPVVDPEDDDTCDTCGGAGIVPRFLKKGGNLEPVPCPDCSPRDEPAAEPVKSQALTDLFARMVSLTA